MTHTVRAAAVILGALAILGGITGCPFMPSNDDGGGHVVVEPDFKARTSPENLLYNLQKAYELRNIAEYESLLAQDFEFVLSEEDQDDPGMPDTWGRQVEIGVHTHMFDADLVNELDLEFVAGNRFWDTVIAPNMWSIIISNVKLRLNGRTPDAPDVVQDLEVKNASSQFWFRENPWTQEGTSNKIWTIVRWEDKGTTLP